jgi:hypothetical protein
MTREAVIETFENLARSQGSYGRVLRFLEECSEVDPDKFEEIMTELEKCESAIDLILTVEG